ncbi:MAG TPA: hypothetical protein VLW50_11365 [Streptosporangiaceae bacterium]|nr:hypothetical protein [Streptosporangiaceae bacterium]
MTIGTAVRPMRVSETGGPMIERQPSDDETLRELAELLRDARPGMLVCGVTVAALTVGVAVEEAALPVKLHPGVGTVLCLGLLAVLALSLVRTAVLMISAGRPLMDELGELRRQTGAPVDPTVPWTPVRTLHVVSKTTASDRARAVLAAAYFRNTRIQLALTWATVAIICFCAWTLMLLVLAGRI